MFKKLDKLVVKAFIGPFIGTFFITLLVLIMQFFWLYIDDFVGKGLSVNIILEFIAYQSAALVPLALPLSILLSSIMTFGNLGESYELVAIKSAGISLLRFMRPLLMVTIFICGIAFLFNNYIIPVANLKSRTLLGDIVHANPSFDLKEGVFYDKLNGFAIKVGKKENDTVIKNIIIYEQNNFLQDNFIIASDGVMRASDDKRYLEFILKNGCRYEERGNNASGSTEYVRLAFKEYKRQFDISSFGLKQRTADSVNKNNARMLSLRQLDVAIDSIKRVINKQIGDKVRTDAFGQLTFSSYLDSNWKNDPNPVKVKSFDQLLPDSIKSMVNERVANKLTTLKMNVEIAVNESKAWQEEMRNHLVEWHRKLSLSAACLVLFLIGAPLGSIIRKGGLGSPLVFAIVFFMFFYFSSNTGEKFARAAKLPVSVGMWLSTYILLPVGLFLTYKAMRDSQLFNKEWYYRFFKKVPFLRRPKK